MVRKVFRFFYKETNTLHKAAYFLGLFALLSQALAFLRDRLLAHIFGAGSDLDVYYAAFRIPDFLFVTIASIVSVSVLVPFIVEKEKVSKEAVQEFLGNIFTFFTYVIVGSCLVVFILMPYLSHFLFKGFSPEELKLAVTLSRILLLSPIGLGFSNLFGSVTQAYNRFIIYAFAPLLYNAGIIVGTTFFSHSMGVKGVAIGVVIGACLHALVQIPFVLEQGLFPKLKKRFDFSAIKKVAALSLPRTLTLSTNHIATIFLVSLASLMPVGSISVYSFSLNLQSVPLAIIGVSYSLAAFPTLTRHFANKNMQAFADQMATTARHIIFWSLPVTAIFIVLRAQIVRVILGSGQFDWAATRLTAAALALFVISCVFQSLMVLFVRAFYSTGHTKKPFYINLFFTIVLIGITYILVKLFYFYAGFRIFVSTLMKVEDLPSTAVLMLPLGYSIGTMLNTVAHWIGFERDFPGFTRSTFRTVFESISASILMGAATYLALQVTEPLFGTDTLIGLLGQGVLSGVVGLVMGIGVLYVMKSKELEEGSRTIRAKFWKTKVIATDPEIV